MLDMQKQTGQLFDPELMKEIKGKFHYVDNEPFLDGRRLYFDNAGGAFRLKRVVDEVARLDAIPDCPERVHEMALYLQNIQTLGENDIRTIFNAKKENSSILTTLTASQAIFELTGAVAENVPGTNIVTTQLEHPSAYDAAAYYAKKTNKELRPVKTNPRTGGVDIEDIVAQIDSNTCLLSFMYASNISGAVLDAKAIIEAARKIKPGLFIIIDSVQHAPHGIIDVEDLGADAMNFAPYKFFGNRGSGIAYVSGRLSHLRHHRLLASPENKWELGSPAPSQFAAITEIVNYVCWLGEQFNNSYDRRTLFVEGMNRIKMHERGLLHRLLEGSNKVPGIRHLPGVTSCLDYEDLTKRDLIVAMGIDRLGFTEAVREYEKRGIIIYERINTSLYSKRMLQSFGIDGCLRVSPLHCHSPDDIDDFLMVTRQLAK